MQFERIMRDALSLSLSLTLPLPLPLPLPLALINDALLTLAATLATC